MKNLFLFASLLLFIAGCLNSPNNSVSQQANPLSNRDPKVGLSPEERFGELFDSIQRSSIFEDSKTFLDCLPNTTTDSIMEAFKEAKSKPDFSLQNFVNLEISLNDSSKKMTINFNEKAIVQGGKVVLKKSFAITTYQQIPYDAFLLKYNNDEDPALWVTSSGPQTYALQSSNFLERLDFKFKKVPFTTTAYLSEGLENKSGVGLMIYDPVNKPNTSSNYLGQNLNIEGPKGIHDSYWKIWLKFRLNGSPVEMSGPFTEQEVKDIINLKRIFIDNQEYIIESTESRESNNDNYEVTFNLVSVTF